MAYTVKQLAKLAGVTPRTLHYYDEIGLLRPSSVGANGYRYYDEAAALRLQQILFYRELALSLDETRDLLEQPDFDVAAALGQHRAALQKRIERLQHLIDTIDRTIMHLKGETEMTTQDLFAGFDEETQAHYEKEAAEMYDPQVVAESSRRWKNYSAADKARIMTEGGAIYRELAGLIGRDPGDAAVQAAIGRWHQNVRSFYEPTPEILRGLGQGYAENPQFSAFFESMHPDLPGFMRQAIDYYVDRLSIA